MKTSSTATMSTIFCFRFFCIVPILCSKGYRPAAIANPNYKSGSGAGSRIRRGDRRDGVLRHFKFCIVWSYAQDDRIVLDADNDTAQPAGGGDAIAVLELAQHLLPLFLALLLRAENHEIQHRDKQQGKKQRKTAS